MVSSTSLIFLAIAGSPQQGPNEALLKAATKRILTKAYSQTEVPPSLMFAVPEPRIEKSTISKTVSVSYPGGMVSFSDIDGSPQYFECHPSGAPAAITPWDERQRRSRATEFAREFMRNRAFLIASKGESAHLGFFVHPLEQGIPFSQGFWLKVNESGVVTHGSFPPPLPEVGKRLSSAERSTKENATATGVLAALDQDPELQQFEIARVQLFWLLPTDGVRSDSPQHVLRAVAERKAVQAYVVTAFGYRPDYKNTSSRKVGSIWVDAESGRAISGRLIPLDQSGSSSKQSEAKFTNNPKQLFIKRTWTNITSLVRSHQESSNPKGDTILARENMAIAVGRLDTKNHLLWLPSATKWKAFNVKYQ